MFGVFCFLYLFVVGYFAHEVLRQRSSKACLWVVDDQIGGVGFGVRVIDLICLVASVCLGMGGCEVPDCIGSQ